MFDLLQYCCHELAPLQFDADIFSIIPLGPLVIPEIPFSFQIALVHSIRLVYTKHSKRGKC